MSQINSVTSPAVTDPATPAESPVTSTETTSSAESTSEESFEGVLSTLLHPDSNGKVSEEDLFAGIIGERLKGSKGGGAFNRYNELLQEQQVQSGSRFSWETSAKRALAQLGEEGVLTADEVTQHYSQAFFAAQLDSNTSALYDGTGGAGDTTIAVAATADAISTAKAVLVKLDDQQITAPTRDINEAAARGTTAGATTSTTAGTTTVGATSLGNPTDGADGFLFKPVAVSNGGVAVLLPESLAHMVDTVVLKSAGGEVLEEGRSTGYGELGTREKFSFTKPGSSYPKDITVEVRLASGELISYSIPDPSQRYD